ncbi:hypothetical protein WJX79_006976 [Trebouxia sp. C0005]
MSGRLPGLAGVPATSLLAVWTQLVLRVPRWDAADQPVSSQLSGLQIPSEGRSSRQRKRTQMMSLRSKALLLETCSEHG